MARGPQRSSMPELTTSQPAAGPESPVFEVSAYDHPLFRWYVCVDDEVAHEEDAVLDQLVVELSAAAGVSRAVREDREVLLVAGSLDRDRLVQLLADWWRAGPGSDDRD